MALQRAEKNQILREIIVARFRSGQSFNVVDAIGTAKYCVEELDKVDNEYAELETSQRNSELKNLRDLMGG